MMIPRPPPEPISNVDVIFGIIIGVFLTVLGIVLAFVLTVAPPHPEPLSKEGFSSPSHGDTRGIAPDWHLGRADAHPARPFPPAREG